MKFLLAILKCSLPSSSKGNGIRHFVFHGRRSFNRKSEQRPDDWVLQTWRCVERAFCLQVLVGLSVNSIPLHGMPNIHAPLVSTSLG